ncbi:hypothetical protein WJX82_007174 [Trebouxia sp. C0006]
MFSDVTEQDAYPCKSERRGLTKAKQLSRYKGVRKLRSGKFTPRIWGNGKNHFLGIFATELEAAQAVDEAHIYRTQAHAPVNLISETHDHLEICRHKDLESFVKHKREQARYQGVKYDDDGRWSVRICDPKGSTRKHVYLGSYLNEKKAASAYDRARIFKELDPVNFPDFLYNRAEITQHCASFDEFVEQTCRDASQATKDRQHSRYTGVSWYSRKNTWEAYVSLLSGPKGTKTSRKKRLGFYSNEDDAAKAADEAQVHHGQKAVDYRLLGVA